MRTQVTFLALVLGVGACQGESSSAPAASSLIITTGNGERQRPAEGFPGTWIDIAPGVQYRQTLVMASGVELREEAWLNGHPFTFEQGWIAIGPRRYGPIADGTHVAISEDGVFANGEKLGDLPQDKPSASGGD
jgi:hypothetical protein